MLGLGCPIWVYGCPWLGLTPYGRVPNCPGSLRGEVGVRFSLFSPLSRVLGDPILGGMGVPCVGSLHVVGSHCDGSLVFYPMVFGVLGLGALFGVMGALG